MVAGWGKDAFGPPGKLFGIDLIKIDGTRNFQFYFYLGNFQYILKKVDVPVLDSNDCEQRLRRTRLGPFFQLSRSSFVCAGGESGKDACTVRMNSLSNNQAAFICFIFAQYYTIRATVALRSFAK